MFAYNLALSVPGVWQPASQHSFRHGPWLGGYQPAGSSEPGGGWSWVTGESWSFTKWDGGEPNNAGGEGFLHFHGLGSSVAGGWNDVASPSVHVYGYVVEWDVDPRTIPEPATLAILALGLAGLGFSRRKEPK